jgi:hypothetical protein
LDENGVVSEHVARGASLRRVYLQIISNCSDDLDLYAGLELYHDGGVVIRLAS